jgi:hypothetical protein
MFFLKPNIPKLSRDGNVNKLGLLARNRKPEIRQEALRALATMGSSGQSELHWLVASYATYSHPSMRDARLVEIASILGAAASESLLVCLDETYHKPDDPFETEEEWLRRSEAAHLTFRRSSVLV